MFDDFHYLFFNFYFLCSFDIVAKHYKCNIILLYLTYIFNNNKEKKNKFIFIYFHYYYSIDSNENNENKIYTY